MRIFRRAAFLTAPPRVASGAALARSFFRRSLFVTLGWAALTWSGCGSAADEGATPGEASSEHEAASSSEPHAPSDAPGAPDGLAATTDTDPALRDPDTLCGAARACCVFALGVSRGDAAARTRAECEGLVAVTALGGEAAAAGCRGALESWRHALGERAAEACATPTAAAPSTDAPSSAPASAPPAPSQD